MHQLTTLALLCPGVLHRFQETVGIINGVDAGKFPAVLTRVIKKLHTKVTAMYVAELSCVKL